MAEILGTFSPDTPPEDVVAAAVEAEKYGDSEELAIVHDAIRRYAQDK